MDSQIEDGNPLRQAVARIGYKIWEEIDLVQMYSHLLVAALFPIYIGAHASLRCPPSVTKEPKKKRAGSLEEEDDDDDDLEEESNVEGLTPSDAIMFPVLAGFTLAGLYFLIQWLKDPKLLNKILGWYFSLIGVFGVGKLAGDCLNVATTFIFPSVWSDGKDLYHIDSTLRRQIVGKQEPFFRSGRSRPRVSFTANKMTPLPGFLSKLEFSEATNARIWAVRSLFNEKWAFVGYVRGLVKIKSRVRFNDIIGLCIGLAAIILYNLTGKAWWLTNLMAFGFCYGTLQLMSPTTFWTGSLVLMGLFVYDVVMVFYT
jgi:minor histocompatibility antigen H13